MAWELTINGNTVIVNTGDSFRISFGRDVNIMGIPMTDEEWAMDMITTAKTIRVSGEVADGEDGKSLSQWFSSFMSLIPNTTFDATNVFKLKDANNNVIAQWSPVVLEDMELSLDSSNPTILKYSIQLRVVSEVV